MYFLFAGERYYPAGGMGDFVGVYPTIEAAVAAVPTLVDEDGYEIYADWYEVATVAGGTLVTVVRGTA